VTQQDKLASKAAEQAQHHAQRWKALVCYIVEKIIAADADNTVNPTAPPALAMG
jgi:hypothetical protein